jgi:XTP/dITP diphosphohydrolase
MNLLLQKLAGQTNRNARFRTVITLFESNGAAKQFEGIVAGKILSEKRGAEGFGYDPIFQPDGFSKTLAEMTMEEKNKISHRAKAIQKLVMYLKQKTI